MVFSASKTKAFRVLFSLCPDTRVDLGSVQFTPVVEGAAQGPFSFKLAFNAAAFSDYFLSMREFKCVQGDTE
jgi:hypothetical protein